MNKKIINLTPHEVNILDESGYTIANFPPSGELARCTATTEVIGEVIYGIPLTKTVMGEITGLPEKQDDVLYIVSRVVAEAAHRDDCLIPDQSIRDKFGRIIGCKSLSTVV